jgi:formate dehydrogenase subunit gamma
MEGAFEAMGQGTVDVNWAKEHHPLWVQEEESRGTTSAVARPAE